MPWWEVTLDGLGVLAVAILVVFAFLILRRRWLSHWGGTFECSVRTSPPTSSSAAATARGWALGLGRYAGSQLEWFRVFSLSPRPQHVFPRTLSVSRPRKPHGAEAFSLYAGHVVVDVQLEDGRKIELAMSESALTGFLAWTEAAPPGPERFLT